MLDIYIIIPMAEVQRILNHSLEDAENLLSLDVQRSL